MLGLAPTLSQTAPSPTSTRGPCANYDGTSRSAQSKSCTPDVRQVFNKRLTASGFPHLYCAQRDMDADPDTNPEPEFGTIDNATVDTHLRQDN